MRFEKLASNMYRWASESRRQFGANSVKFMLNWIGRSGAPPWSKIAWVEVCEQVTEEGTQITQCNLNENLHIHVKLVSDIRGLLVLIGLPNAELCQVHIKLVRAIWDPPESFWDEIHEKVKEGPQIGQIGSCHARRHYPLSLLADSLRRPFHFQVSLEISLFFSVSLSRSLSLSLFLSWSLSWSLSVSLSLSLSLSLDHVSQRSLNPSLVLAHSAQSKQSIN